MRHRTLLLLVGLLGLVLWLVVAPATVEARTESFEAVIHILALFGGPLLVGWSAVVAVSRRSQWPALVMLVVSVPVVLLIVGEVTSRLTGNFGRNGWEVYEDREVFGPGAEGTWRGTFGADREFSVPIRKNELGIGFRGPMPGSKGDRSRVVFLGDSQTEALQVPLDSTYPRRLERLCPDLETVNLGESGIGQVEMLSHLRELGPGLEPDVVIASFLAHNDVRDNLPRLERQLDAEEDYRLNRGEVYAFARRHRLQTVGIVLRRLDYELGRWEDRGPVADPAADEETRRQERQGALRDRAWAATEAAFDSMDAWAEAHDAAFGVWITPGRTHAQGRDVHGATERRIMEYLWNRGIPVLPLARRVLTLPPATRMATAYEADSHLSPRGHAYVATWMADWFREQGWGCRQDRESSE
jgi:hypothetical protein